MTNKLQRYFFVFLMCFSVEAFCYGVITHKAISNRAVNYSKLGALIQQDKLDEIGILLSWSMPINGEAHDGHTHHRYIHEWIGEGAVDEDCCPNPIQGGVTEGWRFLRHFFNPINQHGLGPYPSSLIWGLEQSGDIPGQNYSYYSYKDAREYYLNSLTLQNPNSREASLAKMFYALGHVIHLIQDLASPQHTRNDPHGFGSLYEIWTDQVVYTLPFNNFPDIYPGESQLFDRPEKFWQTNPLQNGYGDGLAEFSNYNFLTQGRNCSSNSGFPNPVCDPNYRVTISSIQSLCNGPSQDAVACSTPH